MKLLHIIKIASMSPVSMIPSVQISAVNYRKSGQHRHLLLYTNWIRRHAITNACTDSLLYSKSHLKFMSVELEIGLLQLSLEIYILYVCFCLFVCLEPGATVQHLEKCSL